MSHAVPRYLALAGIHGALRWTLCSPWQEQDAALAMLSELGVRSATVMRAEIDSAEHRAGSVRHGISKRSRRNTSSSMRSSPRIPQALRRGGLTASQALVARTRVMDSWRRFLGVELDLPLTCSPMTGPRARMRELFVELYDSLAPVARARCQADRRPGIRRNWQTS